MAPTPKTKPPKSKAPDTSGGVRIPGDYTGSRNPREGTGRPGSPENPVPVPKINPSRRAPTPGTGTVTYPKPKDPEPPFGGYQTKAGLSKVPRGLKFSGLVRY